MASDIEPGGSSMKRAVQELRALRQQLDGLTHGRVAAADGYDSDARAFPFLNHRGRYEFRGGLVLAQQALDDILVFIRHFRVRAEPVMSGAASEERALGAHSGQRACGDVILIFAGVTQEL